MSFLLAVLGGLRFFIGHITGKNYFPAPFTKEQEIACVNRMLAGDANARNELIEHNMRLVAHIAKKYASNGYENDDLISIGSIGLIKAVNSYKPEKSSHLATYASRCIENEILMHLRSTKKLKSEVSLSEPIGTDREGNEVSLIDILCFDGPDIHESVETKLQIREMLDCMKKCLDRREQKILALRFGLGGGKALTQREVAEKIGISRSYVSRIEKAAIEKLKTTL